MDDREVELSFGEILTESLVLSVLNDGNRYNKIRAMTKLELYDITV